MTRESLDFINIGIDAVLLGVILAGIRIHLIKLKEMGGKIEHFVTWKAMNNRIDEKLVVFNERIETNAEIIKSITKVTLDKAL